MAGGRGALALLLAAALALAGAWLAWPAGQPDLTRWRALPAVEAEGRRLSVGGRALEVRGVNYLRHRDEDPQRCPELQFGADGNCPYVREAVEADMAQLRGLGVNMVRVFLNYYVFGGARETNPSYDPAPALAHFEHLVAAANREGIYVMPVLLAKYPQDEFGAQFYTRTLELAVRPTLAHMAGRPGILAWDLFNEPDLGGPVDARCWDWDNALYAGCFALAEERLAFVRALAAEVKRQDPGRLTTVSLGFAKNYFEPEEAALRLADLVDVLSYHYYDDDPFDSGRYRQHWYYGEGFPKDLRRATGELHALGLGKPVLITEIGFPTGPSATRAPEALPRDLAEALRVAREDAVAGVVLWPFQAEYETLIGGLFR
jgi:hypothetical protein